MKTLTRRIAVVASTVTIIGSRPHRDHGDGQCRTQLHTRIPSVHPEPCIRRGLLRGQRERSSIHASRRRLSRLG